MAVVSGGLAYGVGSLAKVGIFLRGDPPLMRTPRDIFGHICSLHRLRSTNLISSL